MADEQLVVHYEAPKWTIENAPEHIQIALAVLTDADTRAIRCIGPDLLIIGTEDPVTYRITGWNYTHKVLQARRET